VNPRTIALLAAPALSSCLLFETEPEYAHFKTRTEEKWLSHYEIRTKDPQTNKEQRLGYLRKYKFEKTGATEDEGHTYYKIDDDARHTIGHIEDDTGKFYRVTNSGGHRYEGTWELNLGLKNFFGLPPTVNLFLAPVNPYRD
jgi:hypothetical protein